MAPAVAGDSVDGAWFGDRAGYTGVGSTSGKARRLAGASVSSAEEEGSEEDADPSVSLVDDDGVGGVGLAAAAAVSARGRGACQAAVGVRACVPEVGRR